MGSLGVHASPLESLQCHLSMASDCHIDKCRGHSFPLETGRTTQPPIVGGPYLGKFHFPHPEEAIGSLRPPSPSHLSLPLGGGKAWQDWDHAGLIWTFSQQLPPQKPRLSLRARGLHGGQSMAGPESQLGFRRGVLGEGVKDELKG